ncbi:MAG: GGDEF domain-containing protein, partial [Pseudomonadota bacterium]
MQSLRLYLLKGRQTLNKFMFQPWMVSFLPAVLLCGIWFGFAGFLWGAAVILPIVVIAKMIVERDANARRLDDLTGLDTRAGLLDCLGIMLQGPLNLGSGTSAIVIEIDGFAELQNRMGNGACDEVLQQAADRIVSATRNGDVVARLSGCRFAIAIAPGRNIDMEVAVQLSERIQRELAEPMSVDASSVRITGSVGFCLARRIKNCTAPSLLEAAETALEEARRHGASSIRSYSADLKRAVAAR